MIFKSNYILLFTAKNEKISSQNVKTQISKMDEEQLDDDTDIGMESETQGDEEDSDEDPVSSPSLSAASTPPYLTEDGFFSFSKKTNLNSGKPLSIRRRRGRPKKELDKKPLGIKLKRWRR